MPLPGLKELGAELRVLFRAQTVKQLVRAIQKDDISGIAAEVSFYALFALFPFLMFVAAAAGVVISEPGVALGQLFVLMHRFLPTGTAAVFAKFLEGPLREHRPYLLSFGILVILWAGSQGFSALLKALTRVYCSRNPRRWFHYRALSIGLMIPAAFVCLVVLAVMTGPDVGTFLPASFSLPPDVVTVWSWLRWPGLFLFISSALGGLYAAVPCADRRMSWISVGGLMASLSWIGASAALSAYVDHSTEYSRSYGSIGDLMVLMSWIYVGVFVMLLGAEVDVLLKRELRGEARSDKPAQLATPQHVANRR